MNGRVPLFDKGKKKHPVWRGCIMSPHVIGQSECVVTEKAGPYDLIGIVFAGSLMLDQDRQLSGLWTSNRDGRRSTANSCPLFWGKSRLVVICKTRDSEFTRWLFCWLDKDVRPFVRQSLTEGGSSPQWSPLCSQDESHAGTLASRASFLSLRLLWRAAL